MFEAERGSDGVGIVCRGRTCMELGRAAVHRGVMKGESGWIMREATVNKLE